MQDLIEKIGKEKLFILGALAIIAIFAIIFIISFIVVQTKNKKEEIELSDASNSLRVYIVDAKNDKVRYFNRSRLTRKKTSSITDFYNQFHANDRDKIITWIGNLLDNVEDTPKYLEINVLFNYNKKSYFSILQVSKVDREKGIIYLESYILKYMYVNKAQANKVRKFSSREKFIQTLQVNHQYKGVTLAFHFYNKRTRDDDISHLIFAQIKNVLVPYISPTRPMLEHGDNYVIMSDLKISTKTEILAFKNTIKNEINRLLLINSANETIAFAIGIAENKYFYNDVDKLIESALQLSDIAKDDEKEYLIYEEGRKMIADNDSLHLRTEVERIIQEKKLKYTYQPIYNVSKNRMIGYLNYTEPLDSFFDSIEELKSYAYRTEDDKELFSTIARNSITRFIQEKDGASLRLFYPINVNEMEYVNRTFAHISGISEANIVLILNEDELLNLPTDNNDNLIEVIKTFKSKGYEVALHLNDNEAALTNTVYEAFDAYLISVSSHISSNKSQNRQLPSFQALIEKLLRYNKPIIAIDIPSWSLVEYVVKLGVEIVSSEAIAPRDENVLPINKKSIVRLKNMN